MKFFYISIISFFYLNFTQISGAADGVPEITRKARAKIATVKLESSEGIALLYVRGMTCPSCAIGIRVKISKLDFVDSSRFKRGVDMDCNNQLLSVAVKKGGVLNWSQIIEKIDDAGYVAVERFSLGKNGLQVSPLDEPSK
ncbi:MAG TPA: hypothetical protein DEB48_12270 [Verrucomicrobiales bacterium]|nr:hypothetical protein [Verrucomicrobiales bacterium]|tara:strand:+ start:427 stop:849 length:423 start_codon:yes stop_codon:yes gene_type:complete